MSQTELNGLIRDSSDFSSEDYGKYIDKLGNMVAEKQKVLTDREQKMISGVFLKEQEVKNLLNLGLGGMLRELKMMKSMVDEQKDVKK